MMLLLSFGVAKSKILPTRETITTFTRSSTLSVKSRTYRFQQHPVENHFPIFISPQKIADFYIITPTKKKKNRLNQYKL